MLTLTNKSSLEPSVITDAGDELYCYWILRRPLQIDTVGLDEVEMINERIVLEVGGSADGRNRKAGGRGHCWFPHLPSSG